MSQDKKVKIGSIIHRFDTLSSTNKVMKRKALAGESEGAVVVAEKQTAGRGRMNKKWDSQRGLGLYLSILIRPLMSQKELGLLSIMPAIAVAKAIKKSTGLYPCLKWPNDILLGNRKISGILLNAHTVSNELQFVVVGIGINLFHRIEDFSAELALKSCSLTMFGHNNIDKEEFMQLILSEFDIMYSMIGQVNWNKKIINYWTDLCCHLGQNVNLISNGSKIQGTFEGLDDYGLALIKTTNGLKKISNGEFSLRNEKC